MFEIPDAAPTCSAGTQLVETDEHGPFVIDMPTAATTNGITNTAYPHDDLVNASTANPAAVMAKPSATTVAAVAFSTIFGTSGADTTSPIVAGKVARPASSGDIASASTSWK